MHVAAEQTCLKHKAAQITFFKLENLKSCQGILYNPGRVYVFGKTN